LSGPPDHAFDLILDRPQVTQYLAVVIQRPLEFILLDLATPRYEILYYDLAALLK
jgi:hypothetical protein